MAAVSREIALPELTLRQLRQAPIGVRITSRGFGRDRRYPIISGWRIGE